jgi:EAL domain-containing protein (putative c-di-GMP-specific phosphodiesterase class I)
LAGVEALVRWRHPERGLLSPGSFVERAEASGFAIPMAEWVQRTTCRQATAWLLAGLDLPMISMNIANGQLKPGYFEPLLGSILAETGLDPRLLAIELHEASMPDPVIAQTVLAELASVGITLWADDFGTGPSALPYLTHFPFSVLKIDKDFVWTMMDDPHWARTVTGLIGLAHHLDLEVVAEGVTSLAQIEFLEAHGCDMIQGWYFSPPVPADVITTMLQAGGSIAPSDGVME